MDNSRLGPRPTSKRTDQGKLPVKPSIPSPPRDTNRNSTAPESTHCPSRHKHTFSALRSKPSLAIRLARSKQMLRRKVLVLFCRGQRDAHAADRDVPRSSVPEAAIVRRDGFAIVDVMAGEPAVAEHACDVTEWEIRSEQIESAYPCTSRTAKSALPPRTESPQDAPTITPSASPAASWAMTPASKIGARESVFQRRASFRTLTYDPSIPLVYLDEGRESFVDQESQELQTAGTLLPGAHPDSSHGVSHHGSEDRELEASPSIASPNATSFAISPSPLDSDAFDAALARAGNTHAPPNCNTSSLTPLLIHSDAIFLPSAMEAKTSSALPSSESKGRGNGIGMGSTTSRIVEILRAVQIERHGLAELNRGLREALPRAEGEVGELRVEIAGSGGDGLLLGRASVSTALERSSGVRQLTYESERWAVHELGTGVGSKGD